MNTLTHSAAFRPAALDPATASFNAGADQVPDPALLAQIDAACEQACQAIAPAWPLDRAIAVNPHWGRIGSSVRAVAARMAVLGGIRVFAPRSALAEYWATGRITEDDLAQALRSLPAAQAAGLDRQRCIAALSRPAQLPQLPLLIDVLDDDPQRHARLSWRQAITHQVSQTCASYFDQYQADWQPARGDGLYAFWRDTLTHDHGIGVLMGLPQIHCALDALPATPQAAECWALERLGLPAAVWADYLEAVLLTVNGWASWCAYLGWQARLAGRTDPHLRELLAIRLAWGAILLECKDDAAARWAFAAVQTEWRRAPELFEQAAAALQVDEVWQLALELGYQRELAGKLQGAPTKAVTAHEAAVELQAAFCIDVRSEPLRRALESVSPAIQTIGFAGFFGLPIAYAPLATTALRPQLPGLLAPSLTVQDRIDPGPAAGSPPTEAAARARRQRFACAEQGLAASRWPAAAYAFVEAAGVAYLGPLARWIAPARRSRPRDDLAGLPARYRQACRPALDGIDPDARVALAARVLQAMGLTRRFAPLVLLVGHGSQSANNAQAAALDCGACCGQTGEVNARVLARLLNDAKVRAGLAARGISIPAQTVFLAALHNTTTDEIEAFDVDLLPADVRARWARLQPLFDQACERVRRERAPSLGLDAKAAPRQLLDWLRRRANDGAQTRPEWGLAGNAAFIIAPRHRTRGVSLNGRCFLHDYDAAQDADGSVLELLMTAPMLVTHWINWQYHASRCDPERLGSGNKVLHNVVGGGIGVFEGNGGDLRIGLSRQSLHDGQRWVHEPLRLTVVIDASAEAIDKVVGRHPVVRQLIENGWLHLWRYDGDRLLQRDGGRWRPLAAV